MEGLSDMVILGYFSSLLLSRTSMMSCNFFTMATVSRSGRMRDISVNNGSIHCLSKCIHHSLKHYRQNKTVISRVGEI